MSASRVEIHQTPARALTTRVEAYAEAAIAARGSFSLALPGGSVATTGLPLLATSRVDWAKVDLLWGDERAVPPDHADSNFGLARGLLLDHVPVRAENVHRMPADASDLVEAALAYEATVRRVGLDVVLLGVGPDGHVCSLFPGHPLLGETVRWVAAVDDSPKPPPRRLTLTLPALVAARAVIVVALGASKAEIIAEAVESPTSTLPVAQVLRLCRDATLFLDHDAAGRLRP